MEPAENDYLSLETSAEGDQVFLHASPAGLRRLAHTLEQLASQAETGDSPHDHYFTQAWGSYELSEELQDPSNIQVHHLKLFGWPISRPAGSDT